MSERRDNGPLRVPPERDVPPELRARVLHQALREDAPVAGRRTRIAPVLAGLTTAAVVVGIVYGVAQNDSEPPPITGSGGEHTGAPEPVHKSVQTVVGELSEQKKTQAMHECGDVLGVDTGFRMTTMVLKSPVGQIVVSGSADQDSADHVQAFCTPFSAVTSLRGANLPTTGAPVQVIADSRVQGRLPARGDTSRESYYDGAWFVATPGVATIEARIVVDGHAGRWHATERVNGFVFAATWRALTQAELAGEIRVDYRAISADGTILTIPDIKTSTVTPADTARLVARQTAVQP
jgi:hypothetical protein